jgi:hypothetical protein
MTLKISHFLFLQPIFKNSYLSTAQQNQPFGFYRRHSKIHTLARRNKTNRLAFTVDIQKFIP